RGSTCTGTMLASSRARAPLPAGSRHRSDRHTGTCAYFASRTPAAMWLISEQGLIDTSGICRVAAADARTEGRLGSALWWLLRAGAMSRAAEVADQIADEY